MYELAKSPKKAPIRWYHCAKKALSNSCSLKCLCTSFFSIDNRNNSNYLSSAFLNLLNGLNRRTSSRGYIFKNNNSATISKATPSIPGGLFVFLPPLPLSDFESWNPALNYFRFLSQRSPSKELLPVPNHRHSTLYFIQPFVNGIPIRQADSGCIITGFSRKTTDFFPLARVNASSWPPSRKANEWTKFYLPRRFCPHWLMDGHESLLGQHQ